MVWEEGGRWWSKHCILIVACLMDHTHNQIPCCPLTEGLRSLHLSSWKTSCCSCHVTMTLPLYPWVFFYSSAYSPVINTPTCYTLLMRPPCCIHLRLIRVKQAGKKNQGKDICFRTYNSSKQNPKKSLNYSTCVKGNYVCHYWPLHDQSTRYISYLKKERHTAFQLGPGWVM